MATRMIQRRGTSAEWTAANPVLAAGEIGFETDTTKFKFGDGATAWADIAYFASADALIDGAPELLDTLNELAAAIGDDADFITTITTDIDTKLPLAGGTMSGDITLSGAPTADLHAATKAYVDTATSTAYDLASSDLETRLADFSHVFVSSSAPTDDENNSGDGLQVGDAWLDSSNGLLFVYVYTSDSNTTVWVQTGYNDNLSGATVGENGHDFPSSPSNDDTHKGYVYDSNRGAWLVDQSRTIDYLDDVTTSGLADDQVLMYNSTSGEWENVSGVRLDGSSLIPVGFLTNALDAIRNGSVAQDLLTIEAEIASNASSISSVAANVSAAQSDIDAVTAGVSTDFDTLLKIETYLLEHSTVQTEAEWTADTSVPVLGSINISTGSEVRLKIGDGASTFDNLDYVPTNAYVAAEIATGTADLAPKASPTFTGTVSLPSTTSIGDVDATEIAYLDGVTSGIQGQLDDLDTLKAPLADPTFTGTVSGITKAMVGLSNADNTADTDKPVSTAQQTALDAKLNLAGGTMTGNLILNGDPTQALGAVTKQYVDSVEAGLISRPAVKAATTANLSGTYTNGTAGVDAQINLGQLATLDIDGISTWSQWDGILVKDQTSKAENGRYVVLQIGNDTDTDWILKRCPLCDEADEIPGSYIFVTDGTSNEQTGWVQHVADPSAFTVGTDDIDVYQFAGAGAVTAGTNVSVAGNQVSVVDAPVFAGTVDASAAGVEFSDGTQTKAGVPSLTSFTEKTASYTLDTLDHQDNIVEMNAATATTFTIPTDAALAWPVGASMDIFATGTGEVTIAGDTGVTVNATPGLILRTQWSSATIMKRGANNWVVYGDLKA